VSLAAFGTPQPASVHAGVSLALLPSSCGERIDEPTCYCRDEALVVLRSLQALLAENARKSEKKNEQTKRKLSEDMAGVDKYLTSLWNRDAERYCSSSFIHVSLFIL
jgi:hypothetical protein